MKFIKLSCCLLLCLVVFLGLTACDRGAESLDTTFPDTTAAPTEPAPDVSSVTFADQTVTYDGTDHTLFVESLPEGVAVAYQKRNG